MSTDQTPMSRDEAMRTFAALVRQYGLQWRADVPSDAYALMRRCNEVLNMHDRREAIGLPSVRKGQS